MGNCGWTLVRQYILVLVQGFGVLSKNTSTCNLPRLKINPVTLGFKDDCSSHWAIMSWLCAYDHKHPHIMMPPPCFTYGMVTPDIMFRIEARLISLGFLRAGNLTQSLTVWKCVSFQSVSSQCDLPQVDSSQGVETSLQPLIEMGGTWATFQVLLGLNTSANVIVYKERKFCFYICKHF